MPHWITTHAINGCLIVCIALSMLSQAACAIDNSHQKENAMTAPVRYSDFGAVGDGKADDLPAIARAHAHANAHGLPIEADDQATYYLGGTDTTAIIQTDTDWGAAQFVIDDRDVQDRTAAVFEVRSTLEPVELSGVTALKKNQPDLGITLDRPSLVVAVDNNVMRYIRRGGNQNNGKPQTDIFVVDQAGQVHDDTPILWDFDQLSELTAHPIDERTLTITGGRFTTIANAAEPKYTYYARGITVRRSNVTITGIEHRITGEGEQGAPYHGFLNFNLCADVTVRDALLTGHKTYNTIGRAGRTVPMGSYDISAHRSHNLSFINCRQTNDINDRTYWGLMGSNYCKNLTLDGCTFSRFDAHMGVYNATIRNSELGYMGIKAIGFGTLLIENTTVTSRRFIGLRPDYGSTWRGEFIIRNCTFHPAAGQQAQAILIDGANDGRHDFGYTCHMPQRIIIDGLHIKDRNHPEGYRGPAVFDDFNRDFKDASYTEKYPYIKTKEVVVNNIKIESGKPLRLSENQAMFADIVIKKTGEH